jgi:tetratricopeptide (TPR) repeat protein
MKSFRGFASLLLLMVGSCAPFSAAERAWFQVRTAHFSVVTDAGEKRGVEIARRCERMRAAFSLLLNRANISDPAPLLIFVLNGEKEVDELGDTWASKSRHMGLFLPGAGQSFILIDASGDPWHAAVHEYAHELLNANTSSSTQTWFDEGFAEYFSTVDFTRDRVELGRVPVRELQFLRANGKLMRLADLVRINLNSETYTQNGLAQEMFYAESWLLVHYFFDHQLIGRVEPFFSLIAAGATLDEAVEKSFDMSTRKLEEELVSYAKGEKFRYFSLPSSRDDSALQAEVEPLSPVTVTAFELQLRWNGRREHSKSEAQAFRAEYQSLLTREPRNSVALRGAGLASLGMEDYERSFQFLRGAVELDPGDPLNHYSLSLLLSAGEAAGFPNLHWASLERESEACTRLDPSFADAYRLAASAWLRKGEFERAESAMRRAVSLSPRSEIYKLQLADIELKKHEYAHALALLQELKNSRDPEIARQAGYFLSSNLGSEQ